MVAPIIAGLLATLAQNGLGMLAGAIQAKGKSVIEDKLGVKIPDDASQLTPELLQELKIKEMEHEEFLVEAQIRQAQIELEEDKAYLADTSNARNLGIELSKSAGWLNQNIMPILALVTILGGAIMLNTSTENDVRMAAVSMMTMVLGYFFGSSKGSKDKQAAIEKLGRSE